MSERDLFAQREVVVKIKGLMGVAAPFRQGGSVRITLPKTIGRKYGIGRDRRQDMDEITFFFLETDIGVILCTFSDLMLKDNLQKSLSG